MQAEGKVIKPRYIAFRQICICGVINITFCCKEYIRYDSHMFFPLFFMEQTQKGKDTYHLIDIDAEAAVKVRIKHTNICLYWSYAEL